LHLRVPDLSDTPPTIYHLGGIPRWAWRLNTDIFRFEISNEIIIIIMMIIIQGFLFEGEMLEEHYTQ
jgi:hypothetical protein